MSNVYRQMSILSTNILGIGTGGSTSTIFSVRLVILFSAIPLEIFQLWSLLNIINSFDENGQLRVLFILCPNSFRKAKLYTTVLSSFPIN